MHACRYVICIEHGGYFSPYINVPGNRIGWLAAAAAAVCGVCVSPRALRSSMVVNGVVQALFSGRVYNHRETELKGDWSNGETSAAMPHYFTNEGVMGDLALMVRVSPPSSTPLPSHHDSSAYAFMRASL